MTYLAAFYVGTIIKDTAALVEPRVLPTFHREFSLSGFTQNCHFTVVPITSCTWWLLLCWNWGDLGEADCVQCPLLGFPEGAAGSGRGLRESTTVGSIR